MTKGAEVAHALAWRLLANWSNFNFSGSVGPGKMRPGFSWDDSFNKNNIVGRERGEALNTCIPFHSDPWKLTCPPRLCSWSNKKILPHKILASEFSVTRQIIAQVCLDFNALKLMATVVSTKLVSGTGTICSGCYAVHQKLVLPGFWWALLHNCPLLLPSRKSPSPSFMSAMSSGNHTYPLICSQGAAFSLPWICWCLEGETNKKNKHFHELERSHNLVILAFLNWKATLAWYPLHNIKLLVQVKSVPRHSARSKERSRWSDEMGII